MSNCPICNGQKESSTMTFSVDLGKTIVIVRNTPAMVCSLCGEEWIDDTTAQDLEEVVNEAQNKHRMIEVVDFALESVA
ncbi:MAG: type II toxin-antitoxin system MqsA family antitoxin [Campylobacterales bacterium]|nr:type II toxin-antitoxin system MqsA family antitoxin [Campylobacterales bacterium]